MLENVCLFCPISPCLVSSWEKGEPMIAARAAQNWGGNNSHRHRARHNSFTSLSAVAMETALFFDVINDGVDGKIGTAAWLRGE